MERPFEAYEGSDPYVFVCYSHDDKALVYPEITRLRDAGVHVWYDEGISPGSEWSDALAHKIEQSAVFLYFVTPRSVSSEHCRREVSFALGKPCRILSVHLVPTELPSGLALSLSNRQAILKHDDPQSVYEGKLLRAIGGTGIQDTVSNPPPDRTNRAAAPWRPVRLVIATGVVVAIAAGFAIWLTGGSTHERPMFDRSLAVVPFSVVGPDGEAAIYADTLTEELRTEVTGYQEMRVMAADAGDASYVVSGNVQRIGDDLRVRANLTRAHDNVTVWRALPEQMIAAETGDATDMASTIGRFVRGHLAQDHQCESVRRTTRSTEAAAAYCAAVAETYRFAFGGDEDRLLKLSRAKHAIELDPEIAPAYAVLAGVYSELGSSGVIEWRDALRQARDAVDRGLALAPDDPRLLTERGRMQGWLMLDYPAAEASYRASLASDPLHPNASANYQGLGNLAVARGDVREALDHYRRAVRISENASSDMFLSGTLWFAGNYPEAIKVADAGIDLVGSGPARFYLLVIRTAALDALGQTAEANAALETALASVGPGWQAALAGSLAGVGRVQEARAHLAELETLKPPPIEPIASALAALGDDRAFEWIHKAIDQHIWGIVGSLRLNPTFDGLRDDPRWAQVMAHLESEEATGRAGAP